MERKPWSRRHFLYGMFTGLCVGTVLSVLIYTITMEQTYLIMIPIGFGLGMGIGAIRSILEERRTNP